MRRGRPKGLVERFEAAAPLRAELAHWGYPHYQVAAAAKMHPTMLSGYLRGRRTLSEKVVARIRAAVASLGAPR